MKTSFSFQQWVILGAFFTTLLPVAAGIRNYRSLTPELKLLFWFCVSSFLLDGVSRIYWLYKIPNLFLGHVSTLAEFLFLASIYRIILKSFLPRWLMPLLIAVFTVLAIVNTVFLQSFQYNNSNIKIIESLLLITFALLFLLRLTREMKVRRLERYSLFWVNCAILLFFSSTLFIFIYSNYILLYSRELGIRIWFIHAIFFILFQIILSISLWIGPRNSNLPG